MRENTNTAIAINSLYLYGKLIVVTVTGLFTTRFALEALGVVDFGLFSVLGSVISFIGIFNTIMLSASNRFISVAIGKGDIKEINEQFNINLTIHVTIAIITLLLAIPIGDWYIHRHINYDGDIQIAISVFHYSMIGSIVSFIGVPFNGLLMAKERFNVFCIAEIVSHILKLLVAYLLIDHFVHKLEIYALSQAGLTAIVTIVYIYYCAKHFATTVKIKWCKNKAKYKEVFQFSSWVAFGALATVGKNQGASLLVNAFFNTLMNTALGIANTVNMLLSSFANSISQPMAPQITKSYTAGDMNRSNELLVMSTKYTYLLTLCISAPFLIAPDWIFQLWLGTVPPYVKKFTFLIIVDTLVQSMNSGISCLIFASGKIKSYQVIINSLRLLAIVAAYFVLKAGAPAHSLFYAYIVFSVLIFISSQCILRHTMQYSTAFLALRSYFPSIIITLLFIPVVLFAKEWPPIISILTCEIFLLITILFIGLSKKERNKLFSLFYKTNNN